ncbi:MAG: DUF3859 domain-containing protein [Bacteroidales bacterium]
MAKKKIEFKIQNYGIYTQWERGSKDLPKIKKITTVIPAILDIEFGLVLQIKGGKGICLDFEIIHPSFIDLKTGAIAPSFIGQHFVNSNDWRFFIGDTLWEPIEDKIGEWEIIVWHDGKEIARKKFQIIENE